MSNPWYRMYAEFATDAKVQSMSECMQRRLVMLLCLRCSDVTVTLSDEELAFQLRISEAELAETKALFMRKGFIEKDWSVRNWEKRQCASDTSRARTAAYRERLRDAGVTSQKRPSDGLDKSREEEKRIDISVDKSLQVGEVATSANAPGPTPAALACKAMKSAGIPRVNPSHPALAEAIAEGATTQEFADTAAEAVSRGKPDMAYVVATVRSRRRDAQQQAPPNGVKKPHTPEDFRKNLYVGTPDDQLPAELR